MPLFKVNTKTDQINCLTDEYVLTKSEVVINGKRRDRVTKHGFWTDNVKDVENYINSAHNQAVYELQAQINKLETNYENRMDWLVEIVKATNNSWLD